MPVTDDQISEFDIVTPNQEEKKEHTAPVIVEKICEIVELDTKNIVIPVP